MIAARVAGVPSRLLHRVGEFLLVQSLAAVSMAVSSVASVRRLGGRVFFFTASTSRTSCGCPFANSAAELFGGLLLLLPGQDVERFPALLAHHATGAAITVDQLAIADRGDQRW